MEKNRTVQLIATLALVVGVIGLSIGFAAFSNTLKIKSSATVAPDKDTLNVDFSSSPTEVEANEITAVSNPVGLITADEVNMAGGVITSTNNFYYLYTGSAFWTISPSHFDSEFVSFSLGVTAQGGLKSNTTWDSLYVKPVINIDTSKITFTGVGTKENPYNIEIK